MCYVVHVFEGSAANYFVSFVYQFVCELARGTCGEFFVSVS